MELKSKLLAECHSIVDERIRVLQEALDEAIAAGNEETKSSVGDKYETGRAMMQMEQDKYRIQLMKVNFLKNELAIIDLNKKYDKVEKGALVLTQNGNYFISTSVGKLFIDGEKYFAISVEAPLSKALINKKEKDEVTFQHKKIVIETIF